METGDVKITLAGASYGMRPTYAGVRDIEARTGMTVRELLEVTMAERLKVEEAVFLIWYGCQAHSDQFDDVERLGEVVFAERLTSPPLRASMCKFLLECLYAPKVAQKKWQAEVDRIINPMTTG
jgi:hypothetical protein